MLTLLSCQKEPSDSEGDLTQSDSLKIHTLVIDGNKLIIKEVNGVYYFSEHEKLSNRQFNYLKHLSRSGISTKERSTMITNLTRIWINGIIPFKISYPDRENLIMSAIDHISSRTRIRFVQHTNETDYIEFIPSQTFNYSEQIGREGGQNYIGVLGDAVRGNVIHEIMHALGFFHEQSHPNRDNFIRISYQNMNSEYHSQFNIAPGQGFGPLDIQSIMMYGSFAFSNNGLLTIESLNGDTIIMQRDSLSSGDIAGIAHLYKYSISGQDNMCNSGTYTLNSPPSDANVTWQISDGINATINTTTGNQVTVTRRNNIYATLTLSATITYPQGRVETITKTIYTDCQIPFSIQALRNNIPLFAFEGGVVFSALQPPFRQFRSDWVPLEGSPMIIPQTHNIYAYLPNGTSAIINVNGTNKTANGNGLSNGNPGNDNGIFLGSYTVGSGFYIKANIQN